MGWFNKSAIGQHYESKAKAFLCLQGLTLIEQNFRVKGGEIDLIMQEHNEIVFVEVKYRKQVAYGSASEAVTRTKQRRLIKAALLWLQINNHSPANTYFRFDVVAITGQDETIDWIKNAITEG